MIWLYAAAVVVLLVIHTLACYVDRIYSELGKFLSREFEDNMEVWEQQIEPTLGFSRRFRHETLRAGLTSWSRAPSRAEKRP